MALLRETLDSGFTKLYLQPGFLETLCRLRQASVFIVLKNLKFHLKHAKRIICITTMLEKVAENTIWIHVHTPVYGLEVFKMLACGLWYAELYINSDVEKNWPQTFEYLINNSVILMFTGEKRFLVVQGHPTRCSGQQLVREKRVVRAVRK